MSETALAPETQAPVAAPVTESQPAAASITEATQRALKMFRESAAAKANDPTAGREPVEDEPDAGAEPTVAAGEASGEPAPAEPVEAPALTQGADGRYRRADGTFASAEDIAAFTAQPAPEGQPEAQAPEAIRLTLPALYTERGEEDLELEVADEAVAERLRQYANNGMRKAEYTKRLASVEAREAEHRMLEEHIATNPEDIVFNHLPEEKRISLAAKLLARYWDDLIPTLQQYDQNPVSRVQESAKAEIAIRDNQRALEQKRQAAREAASIETAVRAMIPETASEEEAQDFLNDAVIDLTTAAKRGDAVTASSVQQLLARRLQRYGWNAAKPDEQARAVPVVRAVPKAAVPAPASTPAAAKAPAARPVATPSSQITKARTLAAAVAPQGAGAGPALSPIPTEATSSIEAASQYARKMIRERGRLSS